MAIVRWWRGRTGVERFDLSTRAPLYLVSGSEPVFAVLLLGATPGLPLTAAAVLFTAAVLQSIACVLLLRAGLAHLRGGPRPTPRRLGVAALITAVGLLAVVALPAHPTTAAAVGFPVRQAVALLFCGALTVALTPLLRAPAILVLVGVPAAAGAVVQAATGAGAGQQPWALSYLLFVGTAAYTYRSSVWYLGILWELDRSREVEARLAVAEERLRFARDLHDALGRNLTLIAVNSELAAGLQRRGQDGVPELLMAIRQTAQDSMREVREVAAGSRTTDLDAELAGARSVLRAAGISVRLIGEGAQLPRSAQAALGWVVREATTNIIRHADPTTVRIELSAPDDDVTGAMAMLRIENDGARSVDGADVGRRRAGTGLAGLAERLAALGGDVTAQSLPGGSFRVEARIPLTRSASVPVTTPPSR